MDQRRFLNFSGYKDATLSFIHLIILFIFFISSFFCILFHFIPHLRHEISKQILLQESIFLWSALCLFGFTTLLLICFYTVHSKKMLRIHMKKYVIDVDETVIKSYIDAFWEKQFPDQKMCSEVTILRNQRIEIFVHMQELKDQDQFLRISEKEIGKILFNLLGYDRDFYVTLSKDL